jgi:ribose 5-phosphate isomerase B
VHSVRVALGTDEVSPLTEAIATQLTEAGHHVVTVGSGAVWTDVGREVGQAVAEGRADVGVVCCWTGTGVSMAANKVAGVRAALCTDAETARGARRWNDANVLALSLRLTSPQLASEMLDAFLNTPVDEGEQDTIARLN